MGVDANIIIGERISEEIKSGRKTHTAIAAGFKNAFSSVFDGNITVMIVAIILMVLGSGAMLSLRLFAPDRRSPQLPGGRNRVAPDDALAQPVPEPGQGIALHLPDEEGNAVSNAMSNAVKKPFTFYAHRKNFFLISIAIMIIGIIGIFVRGVQLDIQFTGGAILK